jgi:diguanylate cyclase (GGDEF)-like protein
MRIVDINTYRPSGETSPVAAPGPVRSRGTEAGTGAPAAGDSATILGVPAGELTPRARDAIMQLLAEVDRLKRELEHSKKMIRELSDQADKDVLLPVYNRRAFVRELTRTVTYGERHGVSAALIYFDLDGFKSVNDGQGHAAGDAVLARVAELMQSAVRQSDVVGRLGGDEFGVILLQSSPEDAAARAAALAQRVSTELGLEMSYGVYPLKGGEDPTAALAAADRAMYAQKQGKGG